MMNGNRMRGLLVVVAMCLPMAAMGQQVGGGVVELTGPGAGASEDFDSLASTGSTGTALPTGWYFHETGGNANLTYGVSNGSGGSISGNTYSFGAASSSERAFGSVYSGSLTPTIGALLRNNSGAPLTEIAISYIGEQWRLGLASRSAPDRLHFQFSTNATSLRDTTATWTSVPALSFSSPVTSGTVGALDGNLPANQSVISGSISGFTLLPNETLWIRWNDIDGPDGADDGLAIDDIVFGAPVDIAPSLADSFPRNGDDDFPTNASLILTFSEPVEVDGTWFEIQCIASGYHTPANTLVTGGPTIWYLTPNTPFQADDDCELTLDTLLITDLGDNGYTLDDPGIIAFRTIAPPPNEPPELASTVPAQGASNFPSAGHLHAVFNEAVTVAGGAFTLTCTTSPGIALGTPTSGDGGITWVIPTGTALVAGDACTFGIHRNFIQDLDGALLVEDATIHFNVADFGNVSSYYEGVNLASPAQLRCTLYDTIKGHTAFAYSGPTNSTWEILNQADEDPVDTGKILDVYKNVSYTKYTSGDSTHNREHTWPRSYGLGPTGTPGPATDTHMLHLTDTAYNTARGSMPYANCTGGGCTKYATTPNHGIGGNSDADSNWVRGPDGSQGTFEPWDHVKGNMARASMYMAIRYKGEGNEPNLELTDDRSLYRTRGNAPTPTGTYYMGDLSVLLDWNQFDPPDARELSRNQIVQSFQGNRNPFVDHPEWARRVLFETARAAPCQRNDHAPVAANDDYSVAQDGTLSDDVLANDSDVEFDAAGTVPIGWFTLTAGQYSPPGHGNLSFFANGSFTYTPDAGFCGTDSFTYRASDGARWSTPATVTIAVGSDCDGEPLPDIFADGFETQN